MILFNEKTIRVKHSFTFCSRICVSKTSAVIPTGLILDNQASIRPSQASTSLLFASNCWLSTISSSNWKVITTLLIHLLLEDFWSLMFWKNDHLVPSGHDFWAGCFPMLSKMAHWKIIPVWRLTKELMEYGLIRQSTFPLSLFLHIHFSFVE